MTDRPIIFSAPMVRALLEGRKTQTRRLLNPQPEWEPEKVDGVTFGAGWTVERLGLSRWRDSDEFRSLLLPLVRIQTGDRLYVREHWKARSSLDDVAPRDFEGTREPVWWLADEKPRYANNGVHRPGRHRQAMHMPRWASRLTLNVTDVRVQRLQDISEGDARREGLQQRMDWCPQYRGSDDLPWRSEFPRDAFSDLWNSLHDKPGTTWADNPWIYAVTFDVVRGNVDDLPAPPE